MRKKLVHVTTVSKSLGFLVQAIPFMRERGYEVVAVTSPSPDLDDWSRRLGIPIHAVEMPRRVSPLMDLEAVARLAMLLRSLEPDIVHAHTPKGGLLGMIAATMARCPNRIYHMRGLPAETAVGVMRGVLTMTEQVSCGLASEVICVSGSLKRAALGLGISRPEKLHVMAKGSGQGVDSAERFNPDREGLRGQREEVRAELGIPEDALVIGFIGRLVRDKGIGELVGAWRELESAHPSARMLIVGDYEVRDALGPEVVSALEEDERVHLVGWTKQTPRYYSAMDVVALPTYREGFPNVPLEAAAMGLPVVATRVSGCVDAVVDGQTGALVPARDVGALAEALGRYLSDEEVRREHGMRGQERVREWFTPERIFSATHELYEELLGR